MMIRSGIQFSDFQHIWNRSLAGLGYSDLTNGRPLG